MRLTKQDIIKSINEGQIVVDPYEPSLVSINSLDIRLGADLFQPIKKQYRDLYAPKDTDWEIIPTCKASEIRGKEGYASWSLQEDGTFAVLDDDDCFLLRSGMFYIATTLERVGTQMSQRVEIQAPRRDLGATTTKTILKPCIIPEMKAKSTIGRQGLTVALCAGLGDVGYMHRWALEVRVTDDGDVPIAVGTPIAQVVFDLGTPTESSYGGPKRYQDGEAVRFLPKALSVIRSKNVI